MPISLTRWRPWVSAAVLCLAMPFASSQEAGEVVVASLQAAVVRIEARAAEEPSAMGQGASAPILTVGAGTLISADGLILTSDALIAEAKVVLVRTAAGERHVAKVLGRDRRSDLALLQIPGSRHPHLELAQDRLPKVGERVFAFGRNAVSDGASPLVTDGIVNSVAQDADFSLIQSSARITKGMGGGPLVRVRTGEVIGVNTQTMGTAAEQLFTLSVPTSTYLRMAEQLKAKGRVTRGYVGISMAALDPELAQKLGVPGGQGVLIQSPTPDAPAAHAGMQAGDVALKLNGTPIDTPQALMRAINALRSGDLANFVVYRRGRLLTIPVTTAELP